MSSAWEDIYDVAAILMGSGDIAEGKKILKHISASAFKKISKIQVAYYIIQWSLAFSIFAITLFYIVNLFHKKYNINDVAILFRIMPGVAVALMLVVAELRECIKFHPRLIPWLSLPPECHPPELIPLLNGLKSGAWKARAKRGILPDYIYDNEWVILLFSGAQYKAERGWLSRWGLSSYGGDIEVQKVSSGQNSTSPSFVELRDQFGIVDDNFPVNEDAKSGDQVSIPVAYWLCAIPRDSFDEWFNVVMKTQERKPGETWTEDKRLKHRIVLKAAHAFAWEMADSHQKFKIKDMVDVCQIALEAQKAIGNISFLALKDSDGNSKSTEWVRHVVGNSEKHDYAWIKGTVKQFTGTKSPETLQE